MNGRARTIATAGFVVLVVWMVLGAVSALLGWPVRSGVRAGLVATYLLTGIAAGAVLAAVRQASVAFGVGATVGIMWLLTAVVGSGLPRIFDMLSHPIAVLFAGLFAAHGAILAVRQGL